MADRSVARVRDAETFVAVVEAGGLSAAARRLGRSQPTVSRQLAALETRLGVRLIERSTRRLRLTTPGRAYFERCRTLLAMLRDADEIVADMGGAVRGAIRISLPPTYARCRIAPLLPAFFRLHPEVRLEVVLSGERADLVGTHFDLVVRLGRLDDSALACRALSRERFVLCAAPSLVAEPTPLAAPADLGRRACLATETFGVRSRWAFLRDRRRVVVEVAPRLVSDDLGLLHAATLAGTGFCPLPEYLVAADLAAGTLVRALPCWELPAFRAHAVLPSGRHVPRRVRVLVDYLAASLQPRATSRGASSAPRTSRMRPASTR